MYKTFLVWLPKIKNKWEKVLLLLFERVFRRLKHILTNIFMMHTFWCIFTLIQILFFWHKRYCLSMLRCMDEWKYAFTSLEPQDGTLKYNIIHLLLTRNVYIFKNKNRNINSIWLKFQFDCYKDPFSFMFCAYMIHSKNNMYIKTCSYLYR